MGIFPFFRRDEHSCGGRNCASIGYIEAGALNIVSSSILETVKRFLVSGLLRPMPSLCSSYTFLAGARAPSPSGLDVRAFRLEVEAAEIAYVIGIAFKAKTSSYLLSLVGACTI
ncbi:MAG: hypothetical protein K8F91_18820 [Candidatus Obscuribacterales bacterium]|nr:hypothetical protein [Candidatus Obscuribacterales bacterium]